jgi:hypothetical protein
MPPLPPIRWTGRAEFLLLRRPPELLGVLQLYVVLMLAVPAVAWLMRRVGPVVPAALSLGFYLAVQIMPGENLRGISSA